MGANCLWAYWYSSTAFLKVTIGWGWGEHLSSGHFMLDTGVSVPLLPASWQPYPPGSTKTPALSWLTFQTVPELILCLGYKLLLKLPPDFPARWTLPGHLSLPSSTVGFICCGFSPLNNAFRASHPHGNRVSGAYNSVSFENFYSSWSNSKSFFKNYY